MAGDPQADMLNMSGLQGMYNPNPYLAFTGKIPLAGFADRVPTDAMGRPIQQAPGTTLNSTPAAASSAAAPSGGLQSMDAGSFMKLRQQAMQKAAIDPTTGMAADPQAFAQARYYQQQAQSMRPQEVSGPSGSGMGYSTMGYTHPSTSMMWDPSSAPGAGQAAPSSPAPGAGAADPRQAYLSMLANPGPVTTPGATMQPGATPTGAQQPSVLDSFLAAHPQGGAMSGGGYTNQPFFNTLQQLQKGRSGT